LNELETFFLNGQVLILREKLNLKIPKKLIQLLQNADRVTVLTGAGISAESGIPTFRDTQTGLWANYKPEELATAEGFLKNPKMVWEWYAWRRNKVKEVDPNPGHYALAEMEKRIPHFTLITQNVDGLHRRAGNRRIIELHGNIQRVKCFDRGHPIETWSEDEIPPRCPACGSLLRPDVVWFGEMLPPEALDQAFEAASSCDLFFSIGTSTLVEPAASLPFEALQHEIPVVEINSEPTPLTALAHYSISGPSGKILPTLVEAAWPHE
jgi:NAD-dependent deacetylase